MNISASELQEKLNSNTPVTIIDVREELEFHTFNIGGQNIPVGKLPNQTDGLEYEKKNELIVVCQRGIRSATAQKILELSGFENVRNLEGGLLSLRKIIQT